MIRNNRPGSDGNLRQTIIPCSLLQTCDQFFINYDRVMTYILFSSLNFIDCKAASLLVQIFRIITCVGKKLASKKKVGETHQLSAFSKKGTIVLINLISAARPTAFVSFATYIPLLSEATFTEILVWFLIFFAGIARCPCELIISSDCH